MIYEIKFDGGRESQEAPNMPQAILRFMERRTDLEFIRVKRPSDGEWIGFNVDPIQRKYMTEWLAKHSTNS